MSSGNPMPIISFALLKIYRNRQDGPSANENTDFESFWSYTVYNFLSGNYKGKGGFYQYFCAYLSNVAFPLPQINVKLTAYAGKWTNNLGRLRCNYIDGRGFYL